MNCLSDKMARCLIIAAVVLPVLIREGSEHIDSDEFPVNDAELQNP